MEGTFAELKRTSPVHTGPAVTRGYDAGPMGAGPMGAGPMGAGPMGTGLMGTGLMGTGLMGSDTLGAGVLPVVPALRDLLPRGGLARGSVVVVPESGLLCLALLAEASADGAWCGIAGMPEAGIVAGAGLGLDPERTLLVPDPGASWPQVVASLLDGCELVLVRPPARASAQVRQRLEGTLRRGRGVLVVAGDWPGAQVRFRVAAQGWTGLGNGYGRLRECCAEVIVDGRGEAARPQTRWLWLPAADGAVTAADPADIPAGRTEFGGLRAVSGG
jgi:hypothetical protein